MICRNCVYYHHQWCGEVHDSPDPDMERNCRHYVVAKKYDRVKEFTIEELADFLNQVETDGRFYGPKGKVAWVNWLKKDA